MPFSLANGLSAMGQTVANTAGDMMLNQQRADLEKQRVELAETLAEGRESRGRDQAADIADKASTKEQNFRAGQSVLNRTHEDLLADKREAGDDRRAKTAADLSIKLHGQSEKAATERFNAEAKARIAEVLRQEQNTEKKEILIGARDRASEYKNVGDNDTPHWVKDLIPELAEKEAAKLRDRGHPDLAAALWTNPVKKPTTPAKPMEGSIVIQNGHRFKVVAGKYITQD